MENSHKSIANEVVNPALIEYDLLCEAMPQTTCNTDFTNC